MSHQIRIVIHEFETVHKRSTSGILEYDRSAQLPVCIMGGHAAWRKRVAAGELAKGSGGAALRHRPRLGRKGPDLALNRLGNLGGHGNPKRKTTKTKSATIQSPSIHELHPQLYHDILIQRQWLRSVCIVIFIILVIFVAFGAAAFAVYQQLQRKR